MIYKKLLGLFFLSTASQIVCMDEDDLRFSRTTDCNISQVMDELFGLEIEKTSEEEKENEYVSIEKSIDIVGFLD